MKSSTSTRSAHEKALQDLEAEMKLLHWHKIANETAIQTALMRTKAIREEEERMKPILEESKRLHRKKRLDKVRQEEESKPLEMTREIADRHEEENQRGALADRKRGERRDYQHLRARQKMREREQLKSRRDYCRAAKSAISSRGSSRQEDHCKRKISDRATYFTNSSRDANISDDGKKQGVSKSHDETTRELKKVLKKLEDMVVS